MNDTGQGQYDAGSVHGHGYIQPQEQRYTTVPLGPPGGTDEKAYDAGNGGRKRATQFFGFGGKSEKDIGGGEFLSRDHGSKIGNGAA
jgi:hypothetical protein